MKTPISKTQLLAEMHNENASWQTLLDEIDEANMTQPEVAGGWSIKDIVAHITAWRRLTVSRFQAALNHEPVVLPPSEEQEVNKINAQFYETNRDRPLADVLNDSRKVFQQLVDIINAFSEKELQDPQRFPWLQGEPLSGELFFSHFHEEHESDMRNWLERVRHGR